MENFKEKACLCALNRIFGFEPKVALELISRLGSASAVFDLTSKELDGLLAGPFFKYKGQICPQAVENEADELEKLSSMDISFCGWTDEHYPELLKECEDPPVGIYIRSRTPVEELWKPSCNIAVVGTRDISPYGTEWCTRVVKALSQTDVRPTIISGLALGTDITAHRTALENGLPTIGIMATGPDSVYPGRHRAFAEQMVCTPGCALVSDYPPGTAPVALNFLRRNRIIAGLSNATLLIESKIRGGGMMTCRLAYSYNRDVYALPGRADDLRSQGCNDLIRRKIAEPITSEKELIDSLGLKYRKSHLTSTLESRLAAHYTDSLTDEQLCMMKTIVQTIRKHRCVYLEDLSNQIGANYRTVVELTGILEIDGFICIDLLQRCSINYKNV